MSDEETTPFDTRDDTNLARLKRARSLLARYNATSADDAEIRRGLLDDLLGQAGQGLWIEPPLFCDYGDNIRIGTGVFINLGCVILDGAQVKIGDGALLGPNVQIYATSHPMRAEDRIYIEDGLPRYHTTAAPIIIGPKTWIGGGTIILPGVTIGEGTTIGAGSVVTEDVPAHVFAAGNPCRVIRSL